MTIEERLLRIEHLTAGTDERQRKDHEEDRALWRDSQRQIDQLTANLGRYAAESREADERLGKRIDEVDRRLAENIEELGKRIEAVNGELGKRIEALASGIGAFIARQKP